MAGREPTRPPSGDPAGSDPRRGVLIRWLGWMIVVSSFIVGCVLMGAEIAFGHDNPYVALITFGLPPAGITAGALLVVIGTVIGRRKKSGRVHLPLLDLNLARVRTMILIVAAAGVTFFAVSSVATYRAYHFTESNTFCGQVCHSVMEPEYVAHQNSPHARVACVECHIGSGAEWYVRSKLSGARQLVNIFTGHYELPIKTPLRDLRPAKDTCEHCHWPAKFNGSTERVMWRYTYDESSTPSRYHLLMKVGGVNPASGRPEGIHWHSNSPDNVWYWPRDRERLDIPWVEVEHPDGTRTVYEDGTLAEAPPRSELRKMDCMDCHNRPAHIFSPPAALVDHALAEGKLDRRLKSMKRVAVDLLSAVYDSSAQARSSIVRGIDQAYPEGTEHLDQAARAELIETLFQLYFKHNFPDQGVEWTSYPSHIGHKNFPGCFRCHDGKHRTEEDVAISHQCDRCHDMVVQVHGDDVFLPVTYESRPFEHPVGAAAPYDSRLCSDCHGPDSEDYPANRERIRSKKISASLE